MYESNGFVLLRTSIAEWLYCKTFRELDETAGSAYSVDEYRNKVRGYFLFRFRSSTINLLRTDLRQPNNAASFLCTVQKWTHNL